MFSRNTIPMQQNLNRNKMVRLKSVVDGGSKANCPLVGPGPIAGMPPVGV